MRERGIALLIIVAIVVVAVVVIIGVLGVYFLTKGGTQVTNVELSPVNDGIYLGFQATVYGIGEEVYLRVYDPSGSQIADGFVQPTISGSTKTIRSFFSSHRTCNFGGSPGGTYRLTAELFGGEILYQKNFVFTAPSLFVTSVQLTNLSYTPVVVSGTLTISATNLGDFPAYVFNIGAFFNSISNGGGTLGTSEAVIIHPGSSGTISTTVGFNATTIDNHQFSPGGTYSVHFILLEGSDYVIGTTQTLEVTFPTYP